MSEDGNQSTAPRVAPRRRWLLKILAAFISLSFTFLALEIVFALYYLKKDGKFISVPDRMLSERNAYLNELVPKSASYVDLLFPHPYLSFVHNPDLLNPGMPINQDGFLGQEFPKEKIPGVFVILITGGSAANQFAGLDQSLNILEQALNRDYTNDTVKKFVVLNGAAGAWHQPQQLIMLELYAHVIDGVINLDGFNEHYLLSARRKFEVPADNYLAAMSRQFGSSALVWPLWLDGKLLRLERDAWPFNRSFCFYFAASTVRRQLRVYYRDHQGSDAKPNGHRTLERLFSLPRDWSKEKRAAVALQHYQNYLRMMHAVARTMKIKDLYLVQPAPALDKELTAGEKSVVGDLSYRGLYQTMADDLMSLRTEGVPVNSLLDVFKDQPETIYQDWVHVSPLGNQIIKNRILQLLETEWQLNKNTRSVGQSNAVSPKK